MPVLNSSPRAAAAALLLALGACGRPPGNGASGIDNGATASEPAVMDFEPTGAAPAPARAAPATDGGNRPRERFIVCPGNPRCPPEGSQPKGRQPE